MSWTPTDEQVEQAARVVAHKTTIALAEPDDMDRDVARAVLVAVGPTIAAQALRDAAHMLDTSWAGIRQKASPGWLRNQADIIEKEAGR